VRDDSRQQTNLRRWLAGLFGAYLLFVVYGSLVPLHFAPIGWQASTQSFLTAMFNGLDYSNRADWAANVLLFVPLTFLAMANMRRRSLASAVLVVLTAIALSVAIEYLQTYFPPRQVSRADVIAETAGAIVGVLLWFGSGLWFMQWIPTVLAPAGRSNQYRALLQLYLAGIFIYGLLPLDLTLSATEIFRKWRAGRVVLVPFSFDQGSMAALAYNLVSDVAMWIPVGFLWRLGASIPSVSIVVAMTAVAAAMEFLKLFVESRITDSTHVILAVAGGSVGMMLASFFRAPVGQQARIRLTDPALATLWIVLCVGWLAVLMQIFWFPFDAVWDLSSAARRFREAVTRAPLEMLFYQDYLQAFTGFLRRILFFVPLGACCGLIERAFATRWPTARLVRWCTLSIAVGGPIVIDLGQLFLPRKTPDLTDTALGAAGSLIGYALVRGFRHGTRVPSVAPAGAPRGERAIGKPTLLALVGAATLCVLTWAATNAPGVPYNVGKLTKTGFPVGSVALFVASLYWCFGLPVWLIGLTRNARPSSLLLPPVLLLGYGIGAWCLLRMAVPLPMIEKITGSPILGWPSGIEDIGRLLALACFVGITVTTSAVITGSLFLDVDPHRYARFGWVGWSLVGLPIVFHVVVARAATDNLVELIADGAGAFASACILGYGLAAGAAGASVAMASRLGTRTKRVAWCLAALTLPVGYILLCHGLEPTIIKYGQVFSAMQFLLSADRSSYAGTGELLVRFAVAHVSLVAIIAITQWPFWYSAGHHRRPRLPARNDVHR
jgi:VanZ family protein